MFTKRWYNILNVKERRAFMRKTLAVLGAGNMGLAITDGIIRSGAVAPENIILVRRNTGKLSAYKDKGCRISSDLLSAAREADVLLLCLKPQMMQELFDLIGDCCREKLVISIAAGIKIERIESSLSGSFVVRAMPNTPLTVGEGVTELCRGETVTDEDFNLAKSLFDGAGITFECREEEINALTALTSSAVAYFAAVEDAMYKWAEKNGLGGYDKQTVCDLISKTCKGSAVQLFENKTDPRALIKAVASPRGATERALLVFEEEDLDGMFDRAMTACMQRAEELATLK